jgi:hypothetical protein
MPTFRLNEATDAIRQGEDTTMKFPRFMKTVLMLSAIMATPAFAGNFQRPYAMAVDPNGSLWVGNLSSSTLVVYDHKLTSPPKVITGPELNQPHSIAIDTTNIVYVGNPSTSQISAYGLDGARHVEREFRSAVAPFLLAMGPDHVVYASDEASSIAIYDTVNQNSLLQSANLAQIAPNASIAIGSDNGLFFAADGGGNVNFVSEPSLWAGKQQNTHAYVGSVNGLTFDNFHNGFVTTYNQTVSTLNGDVLISNLPSRAFGIALDKTRNRLFISFPNQNMVNVYTITYDSLHNPTGATFFKTLF